MTDANCGRGFACGRGVLALGARWATFALAAVCSLALMLGACVLSFSPAANADESKTGSIAVEYKDDGDALAGASVSLYKVASWNAKNDGFEPTKPFADYSVDWDVFGADSETFRQLAETLSGYAARDAVSADATVKTDADGRASFDGLARGLYLVNVDAFKTDALACGASSTLTAVPSGTAADASYDVKLQPKTECTPIEKPTTVERSVRKIWKNDSASVRPESITVQLLRDGKVFEEVKLTASNKWSYSWSGLASDHEWKIVEKNVPAKYTVLVDRENAETLITNTHTPPETPPSQPPAQTGSDLTKAAAAAAGFSFIGLLLMRRRKSRS
ncbi:Cna B-type domain-containing protein [Bifidobacterium simiiventris]|uniref:Cna B-type domain-containing protein n=1 Tax=Bifidobacterium simiiventris TaxID=2834434 RepID=UPI001C56B4DD|nr:Cna B-type domain-containing protein [Bifidobacterium simiiventris]MBW3078098.1 Cna B-type domain-containing protein [Bifidobacterium simiiventris]